MAICYKCGKFIKFARLNGKLIPVNADGSEHWNDCKADTWLTISTRGEWFTDHKGEGYKYKGQKHFSLMIGPEIVGENYAPAKCNCIPWEGCEICCPPALTDADVEGMEHLRAL